MNQCEKNKNRSLRRRNVDKSLYRGHVKTTQPSIKCGTIATINVIHFDEDQDSIVLSLETIADKFTDGCILLDYGKVTVYLNSRADLLADIENTDVAKQVDFSLLPDVYNSYKTFLLYINNDGKKKILPKNQYFYTIFERIKKGDYNNGNVSSNAIILLRELSNQKQKGNSKLKEDEKHGSKCCTKYTSAAEKKQKQSHCDKDISNKIATELDCQRNVSLKCSKKKIYFGILKVIKPFMEHIPLLPRLPEPISLTRLKIILLLPLEEQLRYPLQVSEEQRDDEQIHSAQVISDVNSVVYRDSLSYGFSQQQEASNRFYLPVSSNAQSDLQGTERQIQQRPRVPPRHPNYSHYAERLMSYTEWIHRNPHPERLSQAGFFFTNQGDLVRCFQCGIGLKDFSPDDDPLLEHVRHSRQCPFLSELLGDDGLAMYQTRLQSLDPEYSRQQQWAERQSGSSPRSSYRHPEYQAMQARLSSFTNWPAHMTQTPQQLAEAGLYYTGFEDQARCFACDGGLRRWDPEDDPWTEHCRWFPACPYALEQKGEQYIALVQASVENEGYGASGGGVQDLTSTMVQLKLRESLTETIMTQHRAVCLDMGYKEDDVKEAVQEYLERGNEKPSLEDIIVLIDVIRERKLDKGQSSANETPFEENQRLKRIVFCMSCGKNNVNALFLPCTHHELCMTCAGPLNECPVCNRGISEKIRTYMA